MVRERMTLHESDCAFMAEWNRRLCAAPLYTAGKYGEIRVSPSPCDPCQFEIKGIAVYILYSEAQSKGKPFHGARFRTLAAAQKTLDRIARKMHKANPQY